VFGKKDFQQLFIIREMVRQFNLQIEIIAGETIREASGLALSSRNGYLTADEKASAAQLQQCLKQMVQSVQQGNTDFTALTTAASRTLTEHGWRVDYVAICSADTLLPAIRGDKTLVALAAAKLGNTRLIDNIDFSC